MRRNRLITAATVAVILLIGTVLSGCGGIFARFDCSTRLTALTFTTDAIDMKVGDTLEITADMVTAEPKFAADKSFYLEIDDAAVATVDDRTVTALKYGKATLTAVSNIDPDVKAECELRVDYSDPDIKLRAVAEGSTVTEQGTAILPATRAATVRVTCEISEGSDPTLRVVWKVNGETQPDTGLTLTFDVPAGAAAYTIRAELAGHEDLWAECEVRCYNAFDVLPATYDGPLEQEESGGVYDRVAFTAHTESAAENPDPVVDWFINGAFVHEGERFLFVPDQPGEYVVTHHVNGVPAPIGDADTSAVTLKARGSMVPRNLYFEYDNCYPNVFARWDDPGVENMQYAVTLNGTEYSSADARYAHLFDGGSFNATGKVDIFSGFSAKVKSLGNGDLYTPGAYSSVASLPAVSRDALPYLEDTFYSGARNFYLTSDEEFFEAYAYLLLFRPDGKTQGGGITVNKGVYIDYDSRYATGLALMNAAFRLVHFTGEYSQSITGDALTRGTHAVSVTCYSDNAPSTYTPGRTTGAGLNAIRPHINYSSDRLPDAFPIDDKYPVSVRTTEELYYVVEQGYRPNPESGSRAAIVYENARKVLREIIPASYRPDDPAQHTADKVHAVYDWIMWRVAYDNSVLGITDIKEAVKRSAYYLEGVLGWDMPGSAGGTTDIPPFAVCDGMSKACSLLCNILGIDCVRIAGTALSGGSWGGHAWNKVKLPEGWYNVDCTWGDYKIAYGFSMYEAATHEYLFLTDAELSVDHREDTPNTYPTSAVRPYNFYAYESEYDGGTVDFRLDDAETLDAELLALAAYLLDTRPTGNRMTVTGDTVECTLYGIDFYISDALVGRVTSNAVRQLYTRQFGALTANKFTFTQGSNNNYGILILGV